MSLTKNPGRFAGLLYLSVSVIAFFGLAYVPSKLIVHANAAATSSNLSAHEMLFRLGIAAELIGHVGIGGPVVLPAVAAEVVAEPVAPRREHDVALERAIRGAMQRMAVGRPSVELACQPCPVRVCFGAFRRESGS